MPRPRFQFSLRTLLIAMSSIAIGMGILAGVTDQAFNNLFPPVYLTTWAVCGACYGADNFRKGNLQNIGGGAVFGAGLGAILLVIGGLFAVVFMVFIDMD